jgi:hypothetical protein
MRTYRLLPLLLFFAFASVARGQINCSDIRASITQLSQTLSSDGTTVLAQTNT